MDCYRPGCEYEDQLGFDGTLDINTDKGSVSLYGSLLTGTTIQQWNSLIRGDNTPVVYKSNGHRITLQPIRNRFIMLIKHDCITMDLVCDYYHVIDQMGGLMRLLE